MIGKICFACVLIIPLSLSFEIPPSGFKINYEKLFKIGVDAYLENRWKECVSFLERAIEEYIYYHSTIFRCRKDCIKNETDVFSSQSSGKTNMWNFQTLVTGRALCLMKCHYLYFPNRPRTSKETDEEFEKKVPYNYLQLCYYKIDEPEKAASCAYTFLIHNPDHEVMKTNLQYYMGLSNLNVDKVKYLEPKDYQELYLKGVQLYMDGNYTASIEVMELSLSEYLLAEDECRLNCEGPMSETSMEELYVAITNHFTFSLRCKLNCPEKLSFMYGQKHDELLTTHYHYLQFSYYKIKNLKETCSAVESFLLFYPEHKTMLNNKEFYMKLPGVDSEWFVPRKEAMIYYERYEKERNMLKEIEKQFQFESSNKSSYSLTPPPGAPPKSPSSEKRKLGKSRKNMSLSETSEWLKNVGVETYMDAKQLNGSKRVAFLNLTSEKECQQLVELTLEGGVYGDGYNGKHSPHTEFEMFEGLTVARAAAMSHRSILNPQAAQLFLNISEKARQAIEVYFNLETELFFSYTHLVCRTALPDSPDVRNDLSHPIHADNCILTPNGKCLKEKPAYTWRDYSSIIYLNSDFEGGEFIFAKDKKTIQATVKPKCGLMVAFSAGQENLHGVKAVKKGRRCALAMWYTLDSDQREKERDFAETVLSNLSRKRELSSQVTRENSFSKSTLFKFSEINKQNSHSHSEL